MTRFAPRVLAALALAAVMAPIFRPPPSPGGFHLAEFGRLPVQVDGRVQPIESAARAALMKIRRTPGVPAENRRTLGAVEWLLEVMVRPHAADERRIFAVDHAELRRELHSVAGPTPLPAYYSFRHLAPKLGELQQRGERISEIRVQDRTAAERAWLTLLDAVIVYQRLKNGLQPNTFLQLQSGGKPVDYDAAAAVARHQALLPAGAAALKAREHAGTFDPNALNAMMEVLQPYETVARVGLPLFIPPANPKASPEGWENLGMALRDSVRSAQVRPPVIYLTGAGAAFMRGEPAEFNRHVAGYQQWLAANGAGRDATRGAVEIFYNRLDPSTAAAVLYVALFLLGCAFWVTRSAALRRSAAMLFVLALLLHASDLAVRTILEARPPFTNGYSQAVLVGLAAAALGGAIEWRRRTAMGLVTSAPIALLALLAAQRLTLDGGAMDAMRATLNADPWLTMHVGTSAIGLAAMFVAGALASTYILLGVLTRWISMKAAADLDRSVSALLRAALLFTSAAMLAGGIWADRMWGRFWGWDVRENGLLVIALWIVIWLQARSMRLAGERVQMALAACGTMVASMAWIGVGMMGVGLHSYGFMARHFDWLVLFVAAQGTVVGLGLLPPRYWRSHQPVSDSPVEQPRSPVRRAAPAAPQFGVASGPAETSPIRIEPSSAVLDPASGNGSRLVPACVNAGGSRPARFAGSANRAAPSDSDRSGPPRRGVARS